MTGASVVAPAAARALELAEVFDTRPRRAGQVSLKAELATEAARLLMLLAGVALGVTAAGGAPHAGQAGGDG